jgi:Na+(H+)/acetate symporter ActP
MGRNPGPFMIRIDRLIMIQVIAIASAMVAAVIIGGLLAQSWIWAIASAIFVCAGFRMAAMLWVSHTIRTGPRCAAGGNHRDVGSSATSLGCERAGGRAR